MLFKSLGFVLDKDIKSKTSSLEQKPKKFWNHIDSGTLTNNLLYT